jgi:hypothetical protein
MHRSWGFLSLILSLYSFITFHSCGPAAKSAHQRGKPNSDNWLVTGEIANDGYGGGEVLALALDGMRYRSRVDDSQAFAIQLPGNSSYALYFLGSREDSELSSAGDDFLGAIAGSHRLHKEALLNFEESPDIGFRNTLRLPKVLFDNIVSLGKVDIKDGQAFPTINPSLKLDYDNDGINDFADTDDQNDGLSDLEQKQSIERIEICHFNERNQGKSIMVPLSALYSHVQDGDIVGPCVAKDQHASVDASLKETEVAPKSPTPPHTVNPLPATPPVGGIPEPSNASSTKRTFEEKKTSTNDDDSEDDDDDEKTDEDENHEDRNDENDEHSDDKQPPIKKKPVKKSPHKRAHVRYSAH